MHGSAEGAGRWHAPHDTPAPERHGFIYPRSGGTTVYSIYLGCHLAKGEAQSTDKTQLVAFHGVPLPAAPFIRLGGSASLA